MGQLTAGDVIALASFLLAWVGSLAATARWAVSRMERENARSSRTLEEKMELVRQTIGQRFEFNAQAFLALRELVTELQKVTINHESRIYHLQEMSGQWLEGRLHPKNGRGGA